MSKFKLTQTAAEVQGILNGLESDGKGNLTVNKDLEVDGKLTLKSLVSASNPDGDITKELGGGSSGGGSGSARHCYAVSVLDFIYIVNTQKNYNFTIGKSILVSSSDFITNPDYAELHAGGESFNDKRCYPAIGTYKGSESGK